MAAILIMLSVMLIRENALLYREVLISKWLNNALWKWISKRALISQKTEPHTQKRYYHANFAMSHLGQIYNGRQAIIWTNADPVH